MAQVKVKVTRMYFDGEKRVKEGEVLFLDEKQVIHSCHEVLDGKVKKEIKKEIKKESLPGQGPKIKLGTAKEPDEFMPESPEDTPI